MQSAIRRIVGYGKSPWCAPLLAAVAALAVGLIQLRHGIVHLLDTVTYWSGAEATRSGHMFTTNLAPSFSNFSAIEFLERSGRLPFVDFPVGYPLLAGTLGRLTGTRPAMEILSIAALVAVSTAFIFGSRRHLDHQRDERVVRPLLLGLVGVLVTMLPATRLVTQGALSEPLFCAVVIWLVIALSRYRHDGRWPIVATLTIAAGLLRFIGAPLAFLAGWERYQRTGKKLSSLAWSGALILPAALNILWASSAGGGHNAGWRGLGRLDIEVFVRSIGGWFDAKQGDLRRTYFTAEGPSWWSWLVALIWIASLAVAIHGLLRRRHFFTATAELALCSAAIISAGLIAGMMGFDALVIADNRLMLPTGVLTLAAVAWTIDQRLTARLRWRSAVALGALALFAAAAVRPWDVGESFSNSSELKPYSIAALQSGASIIITNDADAVHWDTGLPAAYAPLPVKALTGESQDVSALYRALPCALLEHDGAIVLSDTVTFSGADLSLLAIEVDAGRLVVESNDGASVYFPTQTACD